MFWRDVLGNRVRQSDYGGQEVYLYLHDISKWYTVIRFITSKPVVINLWNRIYSTPSYYVKKTLTKSNKPLQKKRNRKQKTFSKSTFLFLKDTVFSFSVPLSLLSAAGRLKAAYLWWWWWSICSLCDFNFQAISRLCDDKYKDLKKQAKRKSVSADNLMVVRWCPAIIS